MTKVKRMTKAEKTERLEIIRAARTLADHNQHELARSMLEVLGFSYAPSVVS